MTRARTERNSPAGRSWDLFRERLSALCSYSDALGLLADAPPPRSPGRRYYSNLGFFLQEFTSPAAASQAENILYLKLIQRLDITGDLKPGARERIEKSLLTLIKAQDV